MPFDGVLSERLARDRVKLVEQRRLERRPLSRILNFREQRRFVVHWLHRLDEQLGREFREDLRRRRGQGVPQILNTTDQPGAAGSFP